MQKVAIVIPTLNGGEIFEKLAKSLVEQTYKPITTLVIDSESDDNTVSVAERNNFCIIPILRKDFNHGTTRQIAVDTLTDIDIIIYLTQDAILVNRDSIKNIVTCFSDSKISAAFGRQLPHLTSGVIASHARLFNYPAENRIKSLQDAKILGIKTVFISNSFAAYRRDVLLNIGGFPSNTILCEDTYVAAKMIMEGFKVAYCAEAQVYHSHDYSFFEEFRRYFDIGVFNARERWIRNQFGQAEGEGFKFVLSEIKYVMANGKYLLILSIFIRTFLKLLGYKLGIQERKLSVPIKRFFSMHKRYWDQLQ